MSYQYGMEFIWYGIQTYGKEFINWTRMMRRQPYCTRTPITHQLIGGESDEANQNIYIYGDD